MRLGHCVEEGLKLPFAAAQYHKLHIICQHLFENEFHEIKALMGHESGNDAYKRHIVP